ECRGRCCARLRRLRTQRSVCRPGDRVGSAIRRRLAPTHHVQPRQRSRRAWLPDGSGFWYSFERVDRADHDRCLALLPPDGGRIVRMLCDRIPAADDSTDAWTEPAIDAAGRIAYVASSSRVGDVAPRAGALVLATAPALTSDRVVATLPYLGSDQAFRDVAQLRWLGSDALVYVAQRVGY